MKTFIFIQKNNSVVVSLSAESFEEAEKLLFETVVSDYGWKVENEDGEEQQY